MPIIIRYRERFDVLTERNINSVTHNISIMGGEKMKEDRLNEIGMRLNVSRADVDSMKRERRKKRYIYPLLVVITGAAAALMGCLGGGKESTVNETGGGETSGTYPYMIPSFFGLTAVGMLFRNKLNWKRYGILILAVVAIVVMGAVMIFKGSGLAEAVEGSVRNGSAENFSEAVDYGVYSRE